MDNPNWPDNPSENTPFLENVNPVQESEILSSKKLGNRFFGIFVSISIGIYSGLISRTAQESWIYATLFSFEAIICAVVASFKFKNFALKKSITSFSVYFAISAFISPVSHFIGYRFL